MQLYVAEFKNGVIKVGRTTNPLGREMKLRFNGQRAMRIHWCRPICGGALIESGLLNRVRRIGTVAHGREWFTGVRFGQVKHMAEQTTARQRNRA